MKLCKKCNKNKQISEFSKNKNYKDGHNNRCKQCCKKYYKNFVLNFPWMKHFRNAKRRCSDKKIKDWKDYGGRGIRFLLTKDEVKMLYIRDRAIDMKHPTIDRKDSNDDYCFNNCQFIEMHDNVIKRNKNYGKPILQYDLEGNYIREWKSATEASYYLSITNITISAHLKGRLKTAGGFIWRYKDAT